MSVKTKKDEQIDNADLGDSKLINVTHFTNIPEEIMPSFFIYSVQSRSIVFSYNGSPWNCKSKAGFKPHTFARMVSGLNHFLMFWYKRNKDTYNKICSMFFAGLTNVFNVSIELQSKPITSNADRIKALKEHSIISEEMCYYIVEYVDHVAEDTIDESSASTDITLTNQDAKNLASISIVVKLNYLYSGLLRGNMVYDKTMEYTIDSLLYNVIKAVDKYYASNNENNDGVVEETNNDFHSMIDNFIYGLISKIYNDKAKTAYRHKFAEFGKDSVKLGSNRRITIIASLRSYFAKLKDVETARKYNLDPSNTEEANKKIESMYYTHGYTKYEDFTYNALNMASYMNTSLEKIVKSQDLSLSLPDVNKTDFLTDLNDDKSNKREASYFDDKDKHLYHLRKDTMEYIISDFVDELKKISDPNFINMIKHFKLTKKHPFNTFIEYKILLCLTGEAKIYYRTLGIYGKIILALFWSRIKSNPGLVMFHDLVDVMFKEAKDIQSFPEDYIYSVLEQNNLVDPKYKKCKSIFVVYSINGSQQIIDPNIFCQFLIFLEDPKNIIKLLFPNKVIVTEGSLSKYENKYNIAMDNAKPEVKEKAFKYLMNKKAY